MKAKIVLIFALLAIETVMAFSFFKSLYQPSSATQTKDVKEKNPKLSSFDHDKAHLKPFNSDEADNCDEKYQKRSLRKIGKANLKILYTPLSSSEVKQEVHSYEVLDENGGKISKSVTIYSLKSSKSFYVSGPYFVENQSVKLPEIVEFFIYGETIDFEETITFSDFFCRSFDDWRKNFYSIFEYLTPLNYAFYPHIKIRVMLASYGAPEILRRSPIAQANMRAVCEKIRAWAETDQTWRKNCKDVKNDIFARAVFSAAFLGLTDEAEKLFAMLTDASKNAPNVERIELFTEFFNDAKEKYLKFLKNK